MIFSNDQLPALKSNSSFCCCPSSNNSSFLCTLTVHSHDLTHFLSFFASLLWSFLKNSPRHSKISHCAFSGDWFSNLLPQPLTLMFNLKICLLKSQPQTNSVHSMVGSGWNCSPNAKIRQEFDSYAPPTNCYPISTPKHTSFFLREKVEDSHYLSSAHLKVFTCLRPYYNYFTVQSCDDLCGEMMIEFGRPSWVSPKLSSFIAFKFHCLLLGLGPFAICFQLTGLLCFAKSISLRCQIQYQPVCPHSIIFVFCCHFFDHLTSSNRHSVAVSVNLHQGSNIDLHADHWRAI